MNTSDIQQRILGIFAEPSEFDEAFGRVVVWYDAPGEFEDLLPELDLPGVEVLVERPDELFELKRTLNGDLSGRRVLLYRKRARGEVKGDWLADVMLYSQSFEANRAALVRSDINAADGAAMTGVIERYLPFLSKKANIKRIRELRGSYRTPDELHLAVMALSLGRDVEPRRERVFARYLERCRAEGTEAPAAALKASGCWEVFCAWAGLYTGFEGDPADGEAFARHVLLSAFAATAAPRALERLGGFAEAPARRQNCRSLVLAWYGSPHRDGLREACREVERACGVPAALEPCTLDELAGMDVFPCVGEAVLCRLMERDCADAREGGEAVRVARDRRERMWHEDFRGYFDAVERYAEMQAFRRGHAEGFSGADARAVWEGYTGSYCAMDTLYRRFCTARQAAAKTPVEGLDEGLAALAGRAEALYKRWFLPALDEAWIAAAGDDLREAGYVRDTLVPRQMDFFMTEASRFKDGKRRLVVVVSDALRYEVALEVAERVEQRTKGTCERASMQAVFPTETAFGMAALLPHRSYRVEAAPDDRGVVVTVDGRPVATTAQREEALRAAVPQARALRYDEVADLGVRDLRELVGAAGVVFVYHNAVDAVGDEPASERRVFDACADAVEELSSLVERLAGALRKDDEVVVTADHGFLYTARPLDETEGVGVDAVEGQVVHADRRCVLARAGAQAPCLVEVAMANNGAADLVGFAPRAAVRLRRPGAGQNYAHGGASLQELCVPLLRFRKPGGSDAAEAEPPALEVVGEGRTVTSPYFGVTFLQCEPVGGKVVPGFYELTMEDAAGSPVGGPARFKADLADADRQARTISVHVELSAPEAGWDSGAVYHLVVRDAETHREVLREPYRIQIAIADDFGW